MANKTNHAVCIFSQQPNGYRRAGLTLNYGQNDNVQVTEQQLETLKKDTRIKVQELKTSEAASTPPNMEPRGVGSDVGSKIEFDEVDLEGVPEELHALVAIMLVEQFKTKPTVDQLVVEVAEDAEGDNIVSQVKPTASQRDAAWKFYLDNIVNTEQ
ncbi:HI1506-related protein [Pseudoalteromonas byunsanensis]|uniref:Mu-like prophage FluMu N-terminal domain-containing protein n=1 Tax=Pseudoalteromonas byunsanensis TaxID=327939 RepID=A0A1S1NCH2_9GAMM|nr:HI1506-related protein [Pseudoalteromonas byunsanensis]OHU97146.1 hypothetical protein BIW53_02165 [Pseudoalteromonas byunsanensis]